MKNILFKNIAVTIIYLIMLLLVDFVTVKNGKEIYFGYAYKLSLPMFFITALFVNKRLFAKIGSLSLRYLLVIILCGLLTLMFGLIAITVAVNFHFAIGGRL